MDGVTPVGSALSPKLPEDWLEAGVLAVAVVVSLIAGWRAAGAGYALPSVFVALIAFYVVGNVAIPIAVALIAVALVVRRARGGAAPGDQRALAIEVVVVTAALGVYTAGRYLVEPGGSVALDNTSHLISFEKSLHSYFEADFQQFVLRWEAAARFANWVYSFAFLAITGAILLWLWSTDAPNYRLLRNSLGVSALLAVPTLALFPVAPPRLAADSGLIDSIALFGRDHAFANEYAAMPSLHVGWMALAGVVLGRSVGGKLGLAIALILGPLMLLDVVATGNHFWIDGVIGSAYALGAAAALIMLENGSMRRLGDRMWRVGEVLGDAGALAWTTLATNSKALFSFVSLGGLLTYMIVAQHVTPGFTDYWGYLTAQVFVFLFLLVAAEIVFADQGGVSWLTHILAVSCCFADVLGTDGNLYARIDEYDKLTHFAGVAAITAGLYDCFGRARAARHDRPDRLRIASGSPWPPASPIGVGWEVVRDHRRPLVPDRPRWWPLGHRE